jgi:hypothetical protein
MRYLRNFLIGYGAGAPLFVPLFHYGVLVPTPDRAWTVPVIGALQLTCLFAGILLFVTEYNRARRGSRAR